MVVEQYGGVYFDVDVELVKPLDFLLDHEAFFGFETDEYINSGQGFGSIAHGEAIETMLRQYDMLLNGENGTRGCPRLNTEALLKKGLVQNGKLQSIAGAVIYPANVFNPYESVTGVLNRTKDTISIHWYAGTWLTKRQRIRSMIMRPFRRIFGVDIFVRFRK